MKKVLAVFGIFCVALMMLFSFPHAHAGFGITPPYVRSENLTRLSHYEQKITLVRGDPVDDLRAEIDIGVPGADKWITIDKGTSFILPQNVRQIPIVVSVDVPETAEFKNYKGYIRVKIVPVSPATVSGVSIAIGAQIDVDINVIDKKIIDFKVVGVEIADLEEGTWLWWLFFPGKIRFTMQIENVGNVAASPAKVEFDIFDYSGKKLLEKTINKNAIKEVRPFDIKKVVAELPTSRPPGAYQAVYRIYKEQDVLSEGSLNLSILPRGSLKTKWYEPYWFRGLSVPHQASILAVFLIVAGALAFGMVWARNRKKRSH